MTAGRVRSSLLSVLRRHPRAIALIATVLILVSAALFRLSPMWPGPALPAGATRLTLATEPAHLLPAFGCLAAALAPARIAVEGDELVLISEASGERIDVVWPSGWAAWRLGGRAELVDRYGTVVGREGDVIEGFGGGVGTDDAFHVCVFGS